MQDLFKLCQRSRLKSHDIERAKQLFQAQQLNYQDSDSGKTPLITAFENGYFQFARLILNHQETNLALRDKQNKNILHYIFETESWQFIPSPMPVQLLALAFEIYDDLPILWNDLQFYEDFISKIARTSWKNIVKTNGNPIENILNHVLKKIENNEFIGVDALSHILNLEYSCLKFKLDEKIQSNPNNLLKLIIHFIKGDDFFAAKKIISAMSSCSFDQNKFNFLLQAFHTGGYNLVHFIIKKFGVHYFPMSDENGRNIAHFAAMNHHAKLIPLLIDNYEENTFNQVDKRGRLPLHGVNNADVLFELITRTNNINMQDLDGNSFLHVLVEKHNKIPFWENVITTLMKYGADFTLLNHNQKSPLEILLDDGHVELLRFILPALNQFLPEKFVHEFLLKVTQKGFQSLAEIILKKNNHFKTNEKTQSLLDLNNIQAHTLENISVNLSLNCVKIDKKTMELLITQFQHTWGDDFKCSVLSLLELPHFIKTIQGKLKQNKTPDFTIYYLICNSAHWICGGIRIKDNAVTDILIMDPLVNFNPTSEVYTAFKDAFASATIYLSGNIKQARDYYCAIYCLVDIQDLYKNCKFLPPKYQNDLFLYLRDHPMKPNEQLKAIQNFRNTDVFCSLPGYLLRTSRSLNGSNKSYKLNKIVFWISNLSEDELNQFAKLKNKSMSENMAKHIKKIDNRELNLRLEHKIQRLQEKFVDHFLTQPYEYIMKLISQGKIDKILQDISPQNRISY